MEAALIGRSALVPTAAEAEAEANGTAEAPTAAPGVNGAVAALIEAEAEVNGGAWSGAREPRLARKRRAA